MDPEEASLMDAREQAVCDRIGKRLEALGERHPSMKGFRRAEHVNQYGVRYIHGLTTMANPHFAEQKKDAEEKVQRENLGGKAAMALHPDESVDVYAPDGICVMISFDRSELMVGVQACPTTIATFGRYEIPCPIVQGPDTPELIATRLEIIRIIQEEGDPPSEHLR
ncbi:MAG TPA: hypothetical protein VNM14_25740 [Planctomycetota bacterium]|jgi:hypothetical protein|nr:hypothetical protein [Planctomycetota bacterium]